MRLEKIDNLEMGLPTTKFNEKVKLLNSGHWVVFQINGGIVYVRMKYLLFKANAGGFKKYS